MRPREQKARIASLLAAAIVLALLLLGACATARPNPPAPGARIRGIASWYGPDVQGNPTASGEIFDMHRFTAAHNSLPFGTLIDVRNLDNGRTVRVRVNDRGPHVRPRILDLSYAAAQELGMMEAGTARVEITVVAYDAVTPDSPRYTVQVGAFGEAERARVLCDELRGRYPEATVADDGSWHRVQVGTFAKRSDADEIRKELAALGFAAILVVLP